MKTATKSCQQHKPTLSVDPTATPPSAACTNSLWPTSDFDVDWVALHDLPLSADGVDGLADVVPLVIVRRLVDHQPVLVAALQHLTKSIGWMRCVNLDLAKWVTWFVGSFWSHWYLGNGLPSAEQVRMVLLWTPTVAPPVGVTRRILGGSGGRQK